MGSGRRRLGAAFLFAIFLALVALGIDQYRRRISVPPLATEADILALDADQPSLLRFAGNPAILVLVFNDLALQGEMLNRIAALVEKRGLPRERVLAPEEIARAIAANGATPSTWYYGHDYSLADMRRFFGLAEHAAGGLTVGERRLAALLDRAGAFKADVAGALITLPRAGLDPLLDAAGRTTILRHELSHGEFFTNPAFAQHTMRFWREGLDAVERAAFTGFLVREDYDPDNEALLANEMQAYLMHTADPRFFNAEAVGLPQVVLADLRARFRTGMPPGWLRDAVDRPRRRRPQRGTVSSSNACPDRLRPALSAASSEARRSRK
ncbi:MAG: hypothetical protein NT133_20975 [Alphaproteobacteria bacterium]|nr:hypothetical protein [Alphaproteobacteria bacterium]